MPGLEQLTADIRRLAHPQRIVWFSQKTAPDGSPAAVKLCVIISEGDPHQVEQHLYLEIDTDFPFDALVYTAAQWDALSRVPYSLAHRAAESGRVLYEAE